MKVVAVNGGPRKDKISKTTMMLEAFLNGCRDEGAETETLNLRNMHLNHCTGCYGCWISTPGECRQKDDMPSILEKIKTADLEVWATPLYHFGPTSIFKKFLERTLPVVEPYIVDKDGLCTHPLRWQCADKVIISVCGFAELDHFNPMSSMWRFLEGRGLIKVRAEIYRPGAEFMSAPPFKSKVEEILAATRKAGRETITLGTVTEDTMKIIQQDFMDREIFMKQANSYWDWEIERRAARTRERGE